MSRLATVIRPEIQPGRRVIAVSDIHGNLPYLQGLLKKIRFSRADVLVLVGDLLEKGTYSLATLRYVMELQKTHTVYPLCGNCDDIDRLFLEGGPGVDQKLWPILGYWKGRSTLIQMALEIGLPLPRRVSDLPTLRAALRDYFPRETAFLLSLPHILEAGNFLFVHGGVPREDDLESLDAHGCMKNDDFLGQGHSFRKWVVVGHWPVTLYHPDTPDCTPILDQARHIASIDGGCVLKVDGQLNALILPDITGEEMAFDSYDDLSRYTAAEGQEPSANPLNIRWSDSEIEPLAENGDCLFVRHRSSGRTMWVPRDFVSRWRDGTLHTEDTTDYRLPVSPGDTLALVRRCSRGCLVKKDGVTGWYYGRMEPV